jgi:hypothetical protein
VYQKLFVLYLESIDCLNKLSLLLL